MKPLDFSCVLKLSKSQLTETGFKDATVEAVYGGLLTYLADNSNKVGKLTLILGTYQLLFYQFIPEFWFNKFQLLKRSV